MMIWSLEVHDDGIIFRGSVPIKAFKDLTKKFCTDTWNIDMQKAKELDATFVVCKPKDKKNDYDDDQ